MYPPISIEKSQIIKLLDCQLSENEQNEISFSLKKQNNLKEILENFQNLFNKIDKKMNYKFSFLKIKNCQQLNENQILKNINNFWNNPSVSFSKVVKIESIQQLEELEQVENQMRNMLSKKLSPHKKNQINHIFDSFGSIPSVNDEIKTNNSIPLPGKSIQQDCSQTNHPSQLLNQIVKTKYI